jgi:L-iditol 2-dehydrogenase
MKGWVQTEVGSFEPRELPDPVAGKGEAVLRVRAAVTCGTDVKLLSRGHAAVALPVVMGHELCGDVISVGEGVDPSLVGARVVPGVSGPCGECASCRSNLANLCAAGHADRTWGAFAERIRVPAGVVASNLHRVPDGLADEAAAFVDPLASVLHGWNRLEGAGSAPIHRVLVACAGALGLLWARTAALRGVAPVIVARRGDRLELAARFEAELVDVSSSEAEWPSGFDAAVDATGDPEVWSRLPATVLPGGRVLLFGGCAPGTSVTFDAERLHYSEISLIGSFHSTPAEAAQAMTLLASGDVDPLPLLSGTGGLGDLARFMVAQWSGEGIRYAIRPGGPAS